MPYEETFEAMAHPLRQQILAHLRHAPASVSTLTEALPASQPVVSQHLKVLREAELVSFQIEGTRRIYSIEPSALIQLRNYLEQEWAAVFQKIGGVNDA